MKSLRRLLPLAILILLGLTATTLVVLAQAQAPRRFLTVAVLDVGQGDSIYIESPTGRQVVIDGGPDDSLLTDLPAVMPYFDHTLDAVIETHPDADHITGFLSLLKRYQVGMFLEPRIVKDTLTAQALEKEIDQEKIPRYAARAGMWLDLGGGARLDILYPDFDPLHMDQSQDNDGGIVARLVFGSTTMLFMADTSKKVEDHLLTTDQADLPSTILKVGHHGSRTSTGDAFVAQVAPLAAAISLGKNNKYHFPNPEPIATLEKYGVQIFRTDQEGTIVFESDGQHFIKI